MNDTIYLDNNATTQPDPAVVAAMTAALTGHWANPSSVHRPGQDARRALDQARGQAAALVHAAESEISFTGGGTEATNTAIRGLLAARAPRKQLIISTVEHSAIRELAKTLAKQGYEIVEIPVDDAGALEMAALAAKLNPDVALVAMIWANNETGVLFPMAEIAALCKQHRVPLYCDATQAVGKIPVDAHSLGADAMSFAAHKFHGPKGVGALYLRRGLRIPPLIVGGPQERGRRGGTENVPGIVGMGVAAELALASLDQAPRIARQRDAFETAIVSTIPHTRVNGAGPRLPNTTNISFEQLEAEAILLLLSEQNICASAGAACSSGSLEPSPVMAAMHIPPRWAHGAVRFSLSRHTADAELEAAAQVLRQIIPRLRAVLPVGV